MGYEKFLKLTKEAIEELRKYATRSNENLSEESKQELCVYCMLDHSKESIRTVMNDISRNLRYIEYAIRSEVYRDVVKRCEDDNNELVFCGWEYSRDEPDLEISEHMPSVLKTLAMLAIVVKTPDYFKDQELFYEKMNDITSEIEGFCDTCVTSTDFEIINKLAEMGIVDNDDYEDLVDENNDSDDAEDVDYVYNGNQGVSGMPGIKGCGYNVTATSGYDVEPFSSTFPETIGSNDEPININK